MRTASRTDSTNADGFRRLEVITGALLDRLTHHVHILEMNGESYRLKARPAGAGQARGLDRRRLVH
jgi:DNA replication protein DnaC